MPNSWLFISWLFEISTPFITAGIAWLLTRDLACSICAGTICLGISIRDWSYAITHHPIKGIRTLIEKHSNSTNLRIHLMACAVSVFVVLVIVPIVLILLGPMAHWAIYTLISAIAICGYYAYSSYAHEQLRLADTYNTVSNTEECNDDEEDHQVISKP